MSQFVMQAHKILKSYEGDDPYIFVSYAHADVATVMPMMQKLQQDGFRLWYDEGIVGNVDWVDVIAKRLSRCHLFIAFMTKSYSISENCLDELFFAREQCRNRLLVYLDDTEVSKGIRMRYCRRQALYHWQCTNSRCKTEEEFYSALYRVHGIDECRMQQNKTAQISLQAEEQESGATFEVVDGVLIAYHGTVTDVVIPDGVTKIGQGAFKGNKQIESVVFPESLVTVGFESFRDCTHLQKVYTNDLLVRIRQDAFSGCKTLQEIRFPASLKTLCKGAFYGCAALQQINIPLSVTRILPWTFANCKALKPECVILPDHLEVAETAFRGCVSGVERIG